MSVNIFGKGGAIRTNREDIVYRGITMTKADDTFLRRDGGNKAKSDIDLDSHKLVNVANPT